MTRQGTKTSIAAELGISRTTLDKLFKTFEKDIPIYLHTKDEDSIQLVSENTKLWMVTSKADDMYKEIGIDKKDINVPSGIFEYTPEYVKHFKGIEPIQIIDAKAIEGDKSDNIESVFTRVGPKKALNLARDLESLKNKLKEDQTAAKRFSLNKKLIAFTEIPKQLTESIIEKANMLLYKNEALNDDGFDNLNWL